MMVEAYQVFMMGVHLVFVNPLTKNIIKVKLRGVDILLVGSGMQSGTNVKNPILQEQ
jgi:multisubunit Na+/H+ antiporter MnhC subunit